MPASRPAAHRLAQWRSLNRWRAAAWPGGIDYLASLTAGVYPVYATVQAAGSITELSLTNNQTAGQVMIAAYRIFLPIVQRS